MSGWCRCTAGHGSAPDGWHGTYLAPAGCNTPMNIFRLDNDPLLAASYHCDKHVVKMILETAQLLSTAHGGGEGMCKPTHVNHPCAVWARKTAGNYDWLWRLGGALLVEYYRRYGKLHSYHRIMYGSLAALPGSLLDSPWSQTPAPQCMPDQYKHADAVTAYRAYYLGEKMRFARWAHSTTPSWVNAVLEPTL